MEIILILRLLDLLHELWLINIAIIVDIEELLDRMELLLVEVSKSLEYLLELYDVDDSVTGGVDHAEKLVVGEISVTEYLYKLKEGHVLKVSVHWIIVEGGCIFTAAVVGFESVVVLVKGDSALHVLIKDGDQTSNVLGADLKIVV